jgi:cytochrome P450
MNPAKQYGTSIGGASGGCDAVRADRSLVLQLIEDMLRYDSPVPIVFRRTLQRIELARKVIPADEVVLRS